MTTCEPQLARDSVFLIDNAGIILDARQSVCSALGWEHKKVLNRAVTELLEYGGDLLLQGLLDAQASGDAAETFLVSTLVRTGNQGCLPATAVVRQLPELNCFSVAFEDLPAAVAGVELVTDNANSGFRNSSLLSETSARAAMKVEVKVQKNPDEAETALLTATQERRRLETRVCELTGQLQQLHGQLKTNLESESLYQKRVRECEEALQAADQAKAAAEVALGEERNSREKLEGDLGQMKSTWARVEEERKLWEQGWLAKLEASLTALQGSDARLADEISARQEIQQGLRGLHAEFSAQAQASL